jgi:hypothetical protein
MTHLNRVFGAHVVSVLTGQYEDPEGQAIYYRIPLGAFAPDPLLVQDERRRHQQPVQGEHDIEIDLASGLTKPFADGPPSLRDAEQRGLLFGPAVNKLTLMNYVTPGTVRALEWLGSLLPELPHIYLTSSRDECVDKALRLMKVTRKDAAIAIGLDGGYVGHTVATCRSLSDPSTHRGGPGHFAWPRVPHPTGPGGVDATIRALRDAVAAAGGPSKILAFVYEVVQERTGATLTREAAAALAALRTELDIPLIAIETTTSTYRSGHGAFMSPALGLIPDVLAWWGGGQTGYLHTTARWFVSKPLTLVSTWDGDELSLIRQHHQLRAARSIDIAAKSRALDEALAALKLTAQGVGAYRVIEGGKALADSLADRGIAVRQFPNGKVAIIPALDQIEAAAAALRE